MAHYPWQLATRTQTDELNVKILLARVRFSWRDLGKMWDCRWPWTTIPSIHTPSDQTSAADGSTVIWVFSKGYLSSASDDNRQVGSQIYRFISSSCMFSFMIPLESFRFIMQPVDHQKARPYRGSAIYWYVFHLLTKKFWGLEWGRPLG